MMKNGLIAGVTRIAIDDAILRLVRTLPLVWTDGFASWTDAEQEATRRLVAVRLASCRLDVQVTGPGKDHHAIYEVSGFMWPDNVKVQAIKDAGFESRGKLTDHVAVEFGTEVFDVRLTVEGERARNSLLDGSLSEATLLEWARLAQPEFAMSRMSMKSHARRNQGQAIAAAQATASIGDINNHIHNHIHILQQPAPVVNVTFPMPHGAPPGSDSEHWKTLAQTKNGLSLRQSSDVSKLIEKGELKDNGQTGRERRVSAMSILEYCGRKGLTWKETDVDD